MYENFWLPSKLQKARVKRRAFIFRVFVLLWCPGTQQWLFRPFEALLKCDQIFSEMVVGHVLSSQKQPRNVTYLSMVSIYLSINVAALFFAFLDPPPSPCHPSFSPEDCSKFKFSLPILHLRRDIVYGWSLN